eukprot:767836-Prymnesium_polylepis.2
MTVASRTAREFGIVSVEALFICTEDVRSYASSCARRASRSLQQQASSAKRLSMNNVARKSNLRENVRYISCPNDRPNLGQSACE